MTGAPVRNDKEWQTIKSKNIKVKELSCGFGGSRETGNKVGLLGKSIRDNKDSGAGKLLFVGCFRETFNKV